MAFVAPPGQSEAQDRMEQAERYNRWLLARAAPFLGTRVLDLGAGLGTMVALLPAGLEVVALEPDPGFVETLRSRFADRPTVTVVEGDAVDPATTAGLGPFDSILCFNVLEHIEDDVAALDATRELLAPGGHLLLLAPAHPALYGETDRRVGHCRRYTRAALGARLDAAGLEPVELRYVNPLGAVGWGVSSRLLRRAEVPAGPLKAYDALVPVLRALDRLPLPFGLSVWTVARSRDGGARPAD